ncbi:MAG: bile acid:sodium symporter family protein, partial [Candidatus Omnitrophota bacterium]
PFFSSVQEMSVGLILTGAAPGAMSSNVLSYLAGADVAYSVSLTTVSTLLSPLLTPFLTYLLAREILDVPFWGMFWSVAKMVVFPLLLGFWIRSRFDKQVSGVVKIFPAISVTFIVFICSLVIALNKEYILKMNPQIFWVVLLLNLAGLGLGYLVARGCRFDILKTKALTIEIGMQNAGLGSVLALKHFSERAAIPAALFVFVCIFTASILVQIWQRE